jgi:hydroxymethylpyrimidine pyrophosphatase-like HAD family hydrolase
MQNDLASEAPPRGAAGPAARAAGARRLDATSCRPDASLPGRGVAPPVFAGDEVDLLLGGDALLAALRAALASVPASREALLDAYLLAVGLQQVVEDRAGPVAAFVRRVPPSSRPGRVLGALDRSLSAVGELTPPRREERRGLLSLAALANELAFAVLTGSWRAGYSTDRAAAVLAGLEGRFHWRPGDLLRPPSSFRSLDQYPEDAAELARRVLARARRGPATAPGRAPSLPVTVVGVRTSGCYLAPLVGAELARLGCSDVAVASMRPEWPPSAALRAALGRHRHPGSLTVLVDDPPASGGTLADALSVLRRRVRAGEVVAALGFFPGGRAARARLADTEVVALDWEEWHVQRLLAPAQVGRSLSALLGPGHVLLRLERLPSAPPVGDGDGRGHARADYVAELLDPQGRRESRRLRVEGVGIGLYGRQALELARRAPQLFAPVLGVRDGLLFRWLLPCEEDGTNMPDAPALAAHVAARRSSLAAGRDPSARLAGRQPVWEVAGRLVGRSLGPAAPLHGVLVDPIVRRLLAVDRPSIIDGDAAPAGFVAGEPGSPAVRTGFGEGPFGHHDLACYDAVFDLAALVARAPQRVQPPSPTTGADLERDLLAAWRRATGERVDPERWLCYLLVHYWNEQRLGRLSRRAASAAQAGAVRRYFARHVLADLPLAEGGMLCALDLDGVLETSPLGFPATTLAGALALRALRAHGHPVVFVTGRSLADLERRCADYGAVGGVAEYGAVAYDHVHRRRALLAAPLAEGAASEVLVRLAGLARSEADLDLDEDYTCAVRVSARDRNGEWRALSAARTEDLLRRSRRGVGADPLVVPGEEQTDFVPEGVDKGSGLAALLSLLAAGGQVARVALAVGDSAVDEPFLAMARHPVAPANAASALDRAVVRTRRRYQAGLYQAVRSFLGHSPGSCPRCRPPRLGPSATELLGLLSLQEAGLERAPLGLVQLALRSARSELSSWHR